MGTKDRFVLLGRLQCADGAFYVWRCVSGPNEGRKWGCSVWNFWAGAAGGQVPWGALDEPTRVLA